MGNLDGATDLVTVQSFIDYRNYRSGLSGDIAPDLDTTFVYFDIDPIKPEQVKTVELGYRTTVSDKLYIDAGLYFSRYRDFIGYNIGLDVNRGPGDTLNSVLGVDVYRYAANSTNIVLTTGASIGLQYYLNDKYALSGNYSFNELIKTDSTDQIIPAFNTPKHKFNLGLSARGLNLGGDNTWGFGVNYKWVQQFLFEGSPQFTGMVPTYDLVDAQINFYIDPLHTTFKLGGSNLLQNWHIETYGGPMVGRLAYFSVLYEFN